MSDEARTTSPWPLRPQVADRLAEPAPRHEADARARLPQNDAAAHRKGHRPQQPEAELAPAAAQVEIVPGPTNAAAIARPGAEQRAAAAVGRVRGRRLADVDDAAVDVTRGRFGVDFESAASGGSRDGRRAKSSMPPSSMLSSERGRAVEAACRLCVDPQRRRRRARAEAEASAVAARPRRLGLKQERLPGVGLAHSRPELRPDFQPNCVLSEAVWLTRVKSLLRGTGRFDAGQRGPAASPSDRALCSITARPRCRAGAASSPTWALNSVRAEPLGPGLLEAAAL